MEPTQWLKSLQLKIMDSLKPSYRVNLIKMKSLK